MWTVLNILPMMMVAGDYLSFFFTISHNFRGVHMHEDTRREANQKSSFLYNQVDKFSKLETTLLLGIGIASDTREHSNLVITNVNCLA